VTPQGIVLEPPGIAISTAISSQWYPAVAFDGTSYLVVWEDHRGADADIYGARVAPTGTVLDPNGIAISQAAAGQYGPVIGYDQTNFLVAWEDCRSDSSDIYGARVTPDGTVFNAGSIVKQDGNQVCPALARGSSSELFLVYQGWAGIVGSQTYNTERIWGKMNPSPGIADGKSVATMTAHPGPTIVRGVLFLPVSFPPSLPVSLLDVSGRRVLSLAPGPNDVRSLPPGVYFVAENGARSTVRARKVIVAR